MTIAIELPEAVERQLAERASREGKTPAALATEVLVRVFPGRHESDELLAPFREEVARSGTTEDELDAFFDEVRQEIWDEKHGAGK